MKKIIYPIIAALLIGTTFGIILFKNTKKEIENVFNDSNQLSLFQIGVFVSFDNAKNFTNKYEGSIIIQDDIYYRAIYGIFQNKSCVDKMKSFLEENKIDYHIRTIEINDKKMLEEMIKYEEIILQTTDTEVFLKTISKMLELYQKKDVK